MTPADYFTALRRRWADLVLAVVVAVTAAFFITAAVPPAPPVREWRATSVLLATGSNFAPGITNVVAIASLASVGEVPERAAEALNSREDPFSLVSRVKAGGDIDTGLVRITATATSEGEAVRIADAFASSLVSYLRDQRVSSVSADAEALTTRLDGLKAQIAELDQRAASAPGPRGDVIRAERDAQIRQYSLVYESYQQLASSVAAEPGVDIIQEAVALPAPVSGFQVPQSRTARLIIAAILGLLGGVVIVLVIDRFDTRLRSREDAEKHFGSTVLAEIPFVPRRRRERTLAVTQGGALKSRHADAYRILAVMLRTPAPPPLDGNGNGNGSGNVGHGAGTIEPAAPPRAILVTSAGPGDGKTTVVANLAAALAERGDRVLILSCDFRRPRIHRLFNVSNERGLVEAIQQGSDEDPVMENCVWETPVPGVLLAPSGQTPERPAEVLGSAKMKWAIDESLEKVDVVLIDTPPILTTSDATLLLDHVDGVLVVARAGRTTVEVAERTAGILKRVGAPVVGVALNAAAEIAQPRRYYYYRYAQPRNRDRGFSRLLRLSRKG